MIHFDLDEISEKINFAKARKKHVELSVKELNKKINESEKYLHSVEKAQIVLQDVASEMQEQLRFHIKDIVQLAIDTIWPGEIEFDIIFDISKGVTEANLVFLSNGDVVNPYEADGGGLVDICSLGLRIAAWSLENTEDTIILDEPFKNLDNESQPKGAEIIRELSDTLGIQFIILTHQKDLMDIADRNFHVTRKQFGDYKVSSVEEFNGDDL